MVEITITPDRLFLEVKGSHKLWALKSTLDVPLQHVKAVHADPDPAMGWFQGLKIAGTELPHIFRAGMFWHEGDKVFWDVRHPQKTIVIELEDETCAKLIVEVHDPEQEVQKIRQAIADYHRALAQAGNELDQFINAPGMKTDNTSLERLKQKS